MDIFSLMFFGTYEGPPKNAAHSLLSMGIADGLPNDNIESHLEHKS